MNQYLHENLRDVLSDLGNIIPESVLSISIFLLLILGLIIRRDSYTRFIALGVVVLIISSVTTITNWPRTEIFLFNNSLQLDSFSSYFSILFDIGCILTLLLSLNSTQLKKINRSSEYVSLILTIALGAHLLAMSCNFIMIILSLELLSIPAYILTGFHNTKTSAEGSLKYFLYGSVATAIMVYGLSIFFGLTGSLDFSAIQSIEKSNSPLFIVATFLVLAGYLYKISSAPLHLWAPDVYESTTTPIIALFSTVPKLAGIAALTRFSLSIISANNYFDWQVVIAAISMGSMLFGNFSALWQNNPKRLMAYSSIAQSGFLLVGLVAFNTQGIQFMMFYSFAYIIMNFIVFISVQEFENAGLESIDSYKGIGKAFAINSIIIFIGLVSLAGIPPTGGFTAKLFIFTSLWDVYQATAKPILLWLLIFGLLNTVISLFYYLKIPYFSFIKSGAISFNEVKFGFQNLLSLILVIAILLIFIRPDLLMGWLNRINFVP